MDYLLDVVTQFEHASNCKYLCYHCNSPLELLSALTQIAKSVAVLTFVVVVLVVLAVLCCTAVRILISPFQVVHRYL